MRTGSSSSSSSRTRGGGRRGEGKGGKGTESCLRKRTQAETRHAIVASTGAHARMYPTDPFDRTHAFCRHPPLRRASAPTKAGGGRQASKQAGRQAGDESWGGEKRQKGLLAWKQDKGAEAKAMASAG